MNGQSKLTNHKERPLSPLGVWAMALGCIIGWGSFVMPGTSFLPDAGPVGTIIYVSLALVGAAGVPEGYRAWPDYIAERGKLSGIAGMPVLFNIQKALGV